MNPTLPFTSRAKAIYIFRLLPVLGLSALLTVTMPAQEQTIQALKAAGLRDKVKVAIGGAPVTQSFADQIGADCFAVDAADAVRKFKLLIQ